MDVAVNSDMTGPGELETLQHENEQLRADLKRALAAIEKLEVEKSFIPPDRPPLMDAPSLRQAAPSARPHQESAQ